jgi:hypothetical protein
MPQLLPQKTICHAFHIKWHREIFVFPFCFFHGNSISSEWSWLWSSLIPSRIGSHAIVVYPFSGPSYFVATTPEGFYWFIAIDAFSIFRPNLIGHALHRPTLVFPSVTVRGHGDRPTRFRRRSLPFWKGTSAIFKKSEIS